MYTEVKELVNFLAVFMYHRIPKRRINIFMESFANHLVTRFHSNWRPDEPKYAQSERILAIKTNGRLDEMFYTIATTTIFIYCNPGEVTCHISEYSSIIIIWCGDVNEDRIYVPFPIGAAKYYDGNSRNIQSTVFTAYMKSLPVGKKDARPERCVPLSLTNSAGINLYEFLSTGFVDIAQIPPVLFRNKGQNSKPFTLRPFAPTRFGTHHLRSVHKDMRRIQRAAAYLAIANSNAMNRPAVAPLLENFPMNFQFAMNAEGSNVNSSTMGNPVNVSAMSNQYNMMIPLTPTTFPHPVNTYNPPPSVTDFTNSPSAAFVKSGQSIGNPSPMTYFTSDPSKPDFVPADNSMSNVSNNPNCNNMSSDQFTTTFLPPPTTTDSHAENVGFSMYDESNGIENNWCYTIPTSNNASEFEIWKPLLAFTVNNGNSTEPVFRNSYVFDSPMFQAPTTEPDVNQSNAQQLFKVSNDAEVNDLQYNLNNLSFLNVSPELSSSNIFSPEASSMQEFSQQVPTQNNVFQQPQVPLTQVQQQQQQQQQMLPPQQMLPQQVLQSQILQPEAQIIPQQAAVPMQSMPVQPILPPNQTFHSEMQDVSSQRTTLPPMFLQHGVMSQIPPVSTKSSPWKTNFLTNYYTE
uniref:Anti_prolifrtn domain-containing protein n=1 Tax=Wuchereria bancrofti TaxID=6293 RepID=A0A1I8EQV1_WUCBA